MAPQIVLTLGLQLDPAALASIQSQLSALGGATAGGGGNSSLNAVKIQLAQMQAASRLQVVAQEGIQRQSLQSAKSASAQEILQIRQSGQQALLAQKQVFQQQQQAARQHQNELSGFRLSRRFQGGAQILDTLGLPGGNALSTAGNLVQSFGGTIGAGAAAGIGFAAVAISSAVSGIKESVTKYAEVQTQIKLLQALTGERGDPARSAGVAQGFQQQGRQLSLGTGQSQAELAAASYFISSSGFTGSEGSKVLSASSLASQAGLGSVVKFADLLTSSLSAYGETADKAIGITDIFTATVREGKAEPEQLAKSLGLVLPVAAAAGVRMEEVGAAIATITRTGSTAPQAVTQLKQTLSTLIKPSKEAEKALESIGLKASELVPRLRTEGLGSVLEDINKRATATGSRETVLSEIFGNIRAFTGVLSLSRGDFEAYNQILASIKASQGDTAAAAEIMGSTISQQASRIQAAFDGIQISLGEKFAPFVQDAASQVEVLLLRINNALGGDIGEQAKKKIHDSEKKVLAESDPLLGGNFIQKALTGVTRTAGGFPLFTPGAIPKDQIGAERLAAEKELIRVEKERAGFSDLAKTFGFDISQKKDSEDLRQYIKELTDLSLPDRGTSLPGGSSRIRGEYSNPESFIAGPPVPPSIFGENLPPDQVAKRSETIIKSSVGQVKGILGTAANFESAFTDTKDAFGTVAKLEKLKDAQVRFSYTVVNGKRVEGESVVKAGKAYGQYQDALDKLTRSENNLAKAEGAKKPNELTISNAQLSVQNARRDLAQFNRTKPDAQLINTFNPDGTVKTAGEPGAPAQVVTGTRRRGLSKKEQKELEDARLKVEAFGTFVDTQFEGRAVDGFEIALGHLATTSKDGVAPALAQTTLELENYLGATGKAKSTTFTLGLGLQALDNQLAGGDISFGDYTKKLKALQDGIKGLAPQITGAAPITIEQAVEFKLVTKGSSDLVKDPKKLKEAKKIAFGLGEERAFKTPGEVAEITQDVKLATNFIETTSKSAAGPNAIITQLLASQGIDVTKGLEATVPVSLGAAGVDPKAINASILQARKDVVTDAEKVLEPKPPVVMAAGALTDNISAPVNAMVAGIIASLSVARTVSIPINVIGGEVGAAPIGAGVGVPAKPKEPPRRIPVRASGGRVKRNKAHIVGDGGLPELFVPDSDGYVVGGGSTADLMRQLSKAGYGVSDSFDSSSSTFVPPPLTVKELANIAGLYPNTDLGKYYRRNQENALFYLNDNPQLNEATLSSIGSVTPGTAAGVYLSLKAKYDELVRQRDTPGYWRNEEATKTLHDHIESLAFDAKSARQAASAQYYDPITGKKGISDRLSREESLRNLTGQSNPALKVQAGFQQIHDALVAIVVSGVSGSGLGTSLPMPKSPYRPADPVPRGRGRPGGPAIPFAAGGVYAGGTLARVGELGPEYFMSDQSGTFINAAASSRLNSVGSYLDGAAASYSLVNNNQQTFVIDARGATNPQAVKAAAQRGVYMGAREAKNKSYRATGRA